MALNGPSSIAGCETRWREVDIGGMAKVPFRAQVGAGNGSKDVPRSGGRNGRNEVL